MSGDVPSPAPEELIGPRVRLRPFRLEDVPAVLRYASDPEVTRYLQWDAYDDPAMAADFIRSTLAGGSTWVARAITLRATDEVIGGADLRIIPSPTRVAEIGYGLARAHWGCGYASEAAGLLIRFGFAHLGLHRIQAFCAPENARSVRTLLRLGMQREGRLASDRPGRRGPHDLYAVSAPRT